VQQQATELSDDNPCIIGDRRANLFLYVSPFLWGCHEAMERGDGDDASLRHVQCDEYSIEEEEREIEDEND
jgi:hypothetical protein